MEREPDDMSMDITNAAPPVGAQEPAADYRHPVTDLAQQEPVLLPATAVDTPGQLLQPATVHDMAIQMFRESETFEPTEEQKAILFSEVNSDAICVRQHDGQIYIPSATCRALLTQAFPLQWMMMPDSPMPKVEKNVVIWGFYLKIKGVLRGHTIGAQKYIPSNSAMEWDDAMEGAKSNALMRLCKGLGMFSQLWDPIFINKWKKENVESYPGTNSRGQTVTLWRKKSAAMKNCFRIAADELNWTADQIADYMRSHCPVMDSQSGEMTFKNVRSRTEFTPAQWDLQEKHLQHLVENPESRPNFDAEANEETTPPQSQPGEGKPPERQSTGPTQAEKEAGATLQPSAFPINGTFEEQFTFYYKWLERTEEDVTVWLNINNVCNLEALYDTQQTRIMSFFHDTYKANTDGKMKLKLQEDIDVIGATICKGEGQSSTAYWMVLALAECSQVQIEQFLEKLDVKKSAGGNGPRQVRLMTQEQLIPWRETLDLVKVVPASAGKDKPKEEALEPDSMDIPDNQQETLL